MSPLSFKARVANLICAWLRRICYITCSLRFTSGVTSPDLFVTSMVAEPSLLHNCEEALVVLKVGVIISPLLTVFILPLLCQFTNYIVDPVQPR